MISSFLLNIASLQDELDSFENNSKGNGWC